MRFLWDKSRELIIDQSQYWVLRIRRRGWLRKLAWGLVATTLMAFLAGIAGYFYVFHYTRDLTDAKGQPLDFGKLSRERFKRASYVYAGNGQMIGRFYEEIRDPVRLEEIPEQLRQGFVAAEDKRFYNGWTHVGVDPIAIVRAGIGNGLRKINIRYLRHSGASSIVQQYVRLAYEEEVPEFRARAQTLSRKIKEAKIAIQVAKRHSRDDILEDFLNMVYFGHGVNGVAEASQRYFSKDIRKDKLTLREVAILVALNKSPSLYCPIFHRPAEPDYGSMKPEEAEAAKETYGKILAKEMVRLKEARDRYNWVLSRMRDDGYIAEKEYREAIFNGSDPLELGFLEVKPLKHSEYGYSNRLVKELLFSRGFTEADISYYGGLRIYTTIDPAVQAIVSEEFEKRLALVNEGKSEKDKLNGAFVVMEVKTGNILALSGGNDFNESQFNRIMAFRSPGSGFKPFTYITAIEEFGLDYFSKICNCPFAMRGAGRTWAPRNFREDNPVPMGYIDLATGLIRSVNLATLNLARTTGVDPVVDMANKMGVWGINGVVRDSDGQVWLKRLGYDPDKGGLERRLPTIIGASDVNMLELANAYAVLFREGNYLPPTLIREVRSTYGDEAVFKGSGVQPKQVMSPATAHKVLAMMRAVTKVGTAKISMRNIEQQVACKTGTSNGPRDLSMWCGTPDLFIGVRFGLDDYRIIEIPEYMKKVAGRETQQVSGGWVAGPMVRRVIDRIYATRPKTSFPQTVEDDLAVMVQKYQ